MIAEAINMKPTDEDSKKPLDIALVNNPELPESKVSVSVKEQPDKIDVTVETNVKDAPEGQINSVSQDLGDLVKPAVSKPETAVTTISEDGKHRRRPPQMEQLSQLQQSSPRLSWTLKRSRTV